MSSTKRYPGECDEAFPEVFTVPPPQPKEKKPGQLSEDMVKQFFEEGYVIVEDYFKKEELDPCKHDIDEMVDDLAQRLYKAGKITNLYKEYGFYERLTKLENDFPGMNIILHKTFGLTKSFQNLWSNERLLNAVEQLIGPNIAGAPIWNLRTKTPQNDNTTVPWHQDSAYMDKSSYSVMVAVAWIPLLDADEKNGCLQMVRRGHRAGKICKHTGCWSTTWYVDLPEAEMVKTLGVDLEKDVVTCPVKYGGMVLFSNIIPHRSLPNVSDKVRWSFDFRWQDPGKAYGTYGREGVPMRLDGQPVANINFDVADRTQLMKFLKGPDAQAQDEFNTIITGPWMKNWEITHENRHTRAAAKDIRDEKQVA